MTRPALPLATIREFRERFKFCRRMMTEEPNLRSAWKTESHQCLWSLTQIRREWKRGKR